MKLPGRPGGVRVSVGRALAVLLLAHLVLLAALVFRADPLRDYAYMGFDSVQWIADGLFLAGHEVHYTARPPLLPLVEAGLLRVGAFAFFPVVVLAFVHLTAFGIFSLLRRRVSDPVAAALTLAWLLNGNWISLSLLWQADVPAACLLFWSVYAWMRDPEQPAIVSSGVLAGMSALTQPVAALVAAPLAATKIVFRNLSGARVVAATLWAAAPIALWLLARELLMGRAGQVHQSHWTFVRWHTDSIFLYAWNWIAFAGVPLALGTLVGAVLATRSAAREAGKFLLVGVGAVVVVFWVLLYDYASGRFLAYGYVLAPLFVVEVWERWTARVQTAAAVALVAWSMLLPPASFAMPGTITLWPLPPVELRSRVEGTFATGPAHVPGSIEATTRAARAVSRRIVYRSLLRNALRAPREAGLQPEQVADAISGVFLYDTGTPLSEQQAPRAGNLLRKRITAVHFDALEAVWPAMTATRVGEVNGLSVFRAEIAGLDRPRLLLVEPDSRAAAFIETPRAGLPPAPGLAASAERIAAFIGPRWTVFQRPARPIHAYLAILARGEVGTREADDAGVTALRQSPPDARIHGIALYERRVEGIPVVLVAPE